LADKFIARAMEIEGKAGAHSATRS
jgi:hypothetical protein